MSSKLFYFVFLVTFIFITNASEIACKMTKCDNGTILCSPPCIVKDGGCIKPLAVQIKSSEVKIPTKSPQNINVTPPKPTQKKISNQQQKKIISNFVVSAPIKTQPTKTIQSTIHLQTSPKVQINPPPKQSSSSPPHAGTKIQITLPPKQSHKVETPAPLTPNPTSVIISFDPNCLNFSQALQICFQCSFSYYVHNGVCVSVNPNCKTWNNQGKCTSCYMGSVIVDGDCVIGGSISGNSGSTNQKRDINCFKVEPITGKCLQCAMRYYTNKDNLCTPVDPLCSMWNFTTGACTICYSGYILTGPKCILEIATKIVPVHIINVPIKPIQNNGIQNTMIHDISKEKLPESTKTHNNNSIHSQAGKKSSQISNHPTSNIKQTKKEQQCENDDPYCIDSNIKGQCLNCAMRFYLSKGLCTMVDAACLDYNNTNGYCKKCMQGYNINHINLRLCDLIIIFAKQQQRHSEKTNHTENKTTLSNQKKPIENTTAKKAPQKIILIPIQNTDPFCLESDSKTGLCRYCFPRFYVQKGVCRMVDAACDQYNQTTGICLKCFGSYRANGKKCEDQVIYIQSENSQSKSLKNSGIGSAHGKQISKDHTKHLVPKAITLAPKPQVIISSKSIQQHKNTITHTITPVASHIHPPTTKTITTTIPVSHGLSKN